MGPDGTYLLGIRKRKYKNAMVDTISIEDMLLMYVKGEQSNEESHFKRFI